MMADATHTQGPWKVKFQARKWDTRDYTDKYWHDQWVIKGPDNKHSPVAMVRVEGLGLGPSKAVRKANATLIAAAPDLLGAASNALADLEGIMPEFEPSGDRQHPAWMTIAELREAVAKAKGN